MTPDLPYTSLGKQVLRGDEHIADAATEAVAEMIADHLNAPDWIEGKIAKRKLPQSVQRIGSVLADSIRKGMLG